jgi:hypothetical protein
MADKLTLSCDAQHLAQAAWRGESAESKKAKTSLAHPCKHHVGAVKRLADADFL